MLNWNKRTRKEDGKSRWVYKVPNGDYFGIYENESPGGVATLIIHDHDDTQVYREDFVDAQSAMDFVEDEWLQ